MIYATPPAPPAIVHQLPARQRVTMTPVVALPVSVPRYRARAKRAGWPFRTNRVDANHVARAVLRALRRDGWRVTRVRVNQRDAWSDVTWAVRTNARGQGAAMVRRMYVTLNRNGRGYLGTMRPPAVITVDCCQADLTR